MLLAVRVILSSNVLLHGRGRSWMWMWQAEAKAPYLPGVEGGVGQKDEANLLVGAVLVSRRQ